VYKRQYLKSINKIFIVACGTAMHAGLMGKSIIEKLCRIPVEVDIASEFRYRNPIIDEKTLCIFVSQSGETADTLAALRLSKLHGARTLAISNVIGSTITREADYTIYTHAGPEIAVASTKAYTSQVCLIAMLGIYFAELLGSYSKDELEKLKADILDLPSKIEAVLDNCEEIKTFASKVYTQKDMFFLGRGTDYNVALEGSLKLKEISYIHSEAYAAGELKHGPIALIENGVTVIGIITNKELVEKTISNMQEVITRGAKTLIITNQILPNNNFGYVINIPETNELISPILSVIPLQLLSYYISKNKGLDVDKPRNLAKSVTVE
ncbi:MAG: glutamine--fructose-6-phosphate transaminase (isomerizing), partial [Clostridium sp.]